MYLFSLYIRLCFHSRLQSLEVKFDLIGKLGTMRHTTDLTPVRKQQVRIIVEVANCYGSIWIQVWNVKKRFSFY